MLPTMLTPKQMLQLWDGIHIGEQVPAGILVTDHVRESWKRSKEYRVDQYVGKNNNILSQQQLKQRLDSNSGLLSAAIPQMNVLHSITKDAGFCITLSDSDGYILKRVGEKAEMDFTSFSNFVEGSNWSEQVMGTNAIGMVMVHKTPSQIYGFEHFCRCACMSTCSAAPINSPEGEMIGILDLTGPYKYVNAHTLGMVVSSARSIERDLVLNNLYNEVRDSSMLKSAIMKSIAEGLIALDREFMVTLINPQACRMLNIKGDCTHTPVSRLLPETNHYFLDLISSGRHIYGETVHIETVRGRKKFLVNCSPIIDENNRITGNVVTLQELHHVITKIIGAKSGITFENLIGESSVFKDAVEHARIAAENNSNVLLLGESGVGKDLFAKAIHNDSSRRSEPFFAINCAAIPRELISSELFGYNEGAFTGAIKGGKPGAFELADQGTLFLDEIGEMPIDLQASLLRVLEEKTVIRVGGREFIPVNIRLISATNRDLTEEIKNRSFRQDIFYRLSVISITIPPLRQRKGDIPLLVEQFVKSFSERLGKSISRIEPDVIDLLMNYNWPGNVRELSNAIERAVNLTRNGIITPDLLTSEISGSSIRKSVSIWGNTVSKDNMEEEMIRTYMLKFNNNKAKVAKAMNISRSSLYRKLTKYGVESSDMVSVFPMS